MSEVKFNPSAANAATKAIEAANRLCGYDDEPAEKEEDDEIVIYDDGKEENLGLSSLLSAFGINPED